MSTKNLSISAFARLAGCSRQNIHSLIKKSLLILDCDSGQMNPMDPTNAFYLEQRKIDPRIITNPGKEKVKKEIPVKQKKEKIIPEKIPKKTDPIKPTKILKDSEIPVSQRKLNLEVKKLEAQVNGLEIKNAQIRGQLFQKETLGDTVYGYLSALNQNIMNLPKSIIDDFEAAIKSKKTRSEKIDIITSPICLAISETKEEIKKTIDRAKKEAAKTK